MGCDRAEKMIHGKGNRVAPLFSGRNEFFGEGPMNKSSPPAVTCEERIDFHGYNRERTSHVFTCSPGDAHKPYIGLPGSCRHCVRHQDVDAFLKDSRAAVNNAIPFSCHGLSTAHGGIVAVHQGGGRRAPEYLSHEKKEDHRKPEKRSEAPRCPSCQKLTVQVFSVPYQDPGYRHGDHKSCPESKHHTNIPLWIKPRQTLAPPSLAAWAESLKCFVCTCPNTQETAICQHYYALSVICWIAVILTIIVVIAATAHSV